MKQKLSGLGANGFPVVRCRLFLLLASQIIAAKLWVAPSDALRMINLDVPQMAVQGDTIQLSCFYSLLEAKQQNSALARVDLDDGPDEQTGASGSRLNLSSPMTGRNSEADQRSRDDRLAAHKEVSTYELVEGGAPHQAELLYAIKWYKDEREFFRFVTQDWPHKQALPMASLNIDVDKSDNQTVVLRNVTLRTSGSFRCEVSTDAPSFLTKSIERKVLIYSLPTEGPMIEQKSSSKSAVSRQLQYIGDQLDFTCLSRESKPHVELDWILNENFNLTAGMPLRKPDSQLPALFQVETKRLIRLQNQIATQDDLLDLINSNSDIPSSSRAGRTTYVLEKVSDTQLIAKPIGGPESNQAMALSVDSLNRLPEVTMSRLNLSVNADLIQLLSGSEQSQRQTANRTWRTKKAFAQTSQSRSTNLTPRGTLPLSADISLASQKRSTSEPRFALRIRCVSRVLHLKMSDDIKLMVVNRTRRSTLGTKDSLTTQQSTREKMGENSAGGSRFKNFQGLLMMAFSLMVCIFTPNLLADVMDGSSFIVENNIQFIIYQ